MSEQNRYRIERNWKKATGEWRVWEKSWVEKADTWQDAIQEWIDYDWAAEEYTVVSETPSEDGKSGIIEIQLVPAGIYLVGAKLEATLIDD